MEATEKNRAIVEAGLSKRKAARQAQEQAHEDMRRAMFNTISSNYEGAEIRRAAEAEVKRKKADERKAQRAQEAARAEAVSEWNALMRLWDKSVRRIYGALAVGAITCILLVLGGIQTWVAIPMYIGCFIVSLWEMVKEIRRWPAVKAAHQKLEDMRE